MKGGTASMTKTVEHNTDQIIGRRIREKRAEAGMTLQHVAEQIGVDRDTLYKWETGRHRMAASKLIAIAEVIGCSSISLLRGVNIRATAAADIVESFDKLPEAQRVAILRSMIRGEDAAAE